jgi:hypothetical protein
MSVPAANPGRSIAHRIVTRVALSQMGLRFLRDIDHDQQPRADCTPCHTKGLHI